MGTPCFRILYWKGTGNIFTGSLTIFMQISVHIFLLTCLVACDLYSLPSIIRKIKSGRMRWAGHVAQMREKRNAYRLFVRKRPLGIPRRRWVDNIRMDLGQMGWGEVDWICLAQDRNR
jgi:hypothetical protein